MCKLRPYSIGWTMVMVVAVAMMCIVRPAEGFTVTQQQSPVAVSLAVRVPMFTSTSAGPVHRFRRVHRAPLPVVHGCSVPQPKPHQQKPTKASSTSLSMSPLDAVSTSDMVSSVSLLISAASAVAEESPSWWDSYISIFEWSLKWVHSTIDGPLRSVGVEQTWGISIFIFTTLIRSALLPLSIQQSKSAEYMKALKPYVADIKTKFKGNDSAITRATGKLYEDANQNPLAGCLVSLAQLPVFLGLYRGVRMLAIDDQLNEPFLWIPSLEGPVTAPDYQGLDWLVKGWTTAAADGGALPIPPLGWETTIAFLIMPLVLVVLQSITMRALQPPVDDNMSDEEKSQMETTQQVFKFLPLLIGVFSLQVPAGLTIYWFTSNIFTLSQSLGVRAYFAANPPKVELPDYWDTALTGDGKDMTPEERRKASEAGIRVGPSYEDMIDEARFHCRIERDSLRLKGSGETDHDASGSTDNRRVTTVNAVANYPSALQAWVALGGGGNTGSVGGINNSESATPVVAVATE